MNAPDIHAMVGRIPERELVLFWAMLFAPVGINTAAGMLLLIKRASIASFVDRQLDRLRDAVSARRQARIQLPLDSDEAACSSPPALPGMNAKIALPSVSRWWLLLGILLNVANIVVARLGAQAVIIDTGDRKYKWMPFGLSWVLVVPALWILNAIIMVHTIVFAWIQRKGPAPVRARQFGTNVGQLAVVLIALPLVTYITSLPYLHPFFGGWVTDVLDAVILPSIGMCIFAWGRHLKSTYGEPASLAAADEDTLEPPIEVEST